MDEEYWIKYGFKENGELVCLRSISGSRSDENFFYNDEGQHKKVRNPGVFKLTKEAIDALNRKGKV